MSPDHIFPASRLSLFRWGLLVCLALAACGPQEQTLTQEAQILKQELLAEMARLESSLAKPVAREDWEAVKEILPNVIEEIKREGKIIPSRLVVLDRYGMTQITFPSRAEEYFNFYNYEPARMVFGQKRKAQAILYLHMEKFFVVLMPIVENEQVKGAIALFFLEEEVQNKFRVSEQDFMKINFNK